MQLVQIAQQPATLEGKSLVLPAVSVGNVGQLALDLLINTAAAPCTGRLQTTCLLPCIGRGAYDHQPAESLATPLELYIPKVGSVAYLQQRSPAALGQQAVFAKQLAEQLQKLRPEEVVVLASLDAAGRFDHQLSQPPVSFRSSSPELSQRCQALDIPELQAAPASEPAYEDRLLPPWPLMQVCSEKEIPVTTLFTFCSEGDNAPHGVLLANAVHKLLARSGGDQSAEQPSTESCVPHWQPPHAWQQLYGPVQPAF
ncbi:hypothetical protein WJX74_007083 [Apatococcus lobatus]|uniref:Proteasome assembly chaperone 2 n=1 Tax=Apatococcus lobatus TaxID=904363 RepID=A0AAW1QWZ6_9CHLO